jgi:cytoskeletal protein RodZ
MESFGARLKRERERRGITLEDISVSTKIGTRMLHALEEDHFDQLPGGIFNRGFVRAYAHHLGMDEEQVIADYLAASGDNIPGRIPESEEEAEVVGVRAQEENARAGGVPWGIFALIVLLVAIGVTIWGSYAREKHKQAAEEAVPESSQPARVTPAAAPPAVTAKPVPAASGLSSLGVAAKPAAAPASPVPGAFVVRISAREDCWVSLTADGKEIFQDTLTAASEKSVGARQQIVIRAGNVGALDLFFNGRKLSSQGDFGEVKTLTFDASGLRPAPPKPPETEPAVPPPAGPS